MRYFGAAFLLLLMISATHAQGNRRSQQAACEALVRHLYAISAIQGRDVGQANLAAFHQFGRGGLSKNEEEAARLYRLAAEQGNVRAQNNLAVFYANGRGGLPKDEDEAARLFQLAADRDSTEGRINLKWMNKDGGGDPALLIYDLPQRSNCTVHRVQRQGHSVPVITVAP
jgi:TPR repeat protein